MARQRDRSPWNRRPRAKSLATVRSWDEVPEDMSEAEEDEFWRTHELGDELFDRAGPLPEEVQSVIERARQRRTTQAARPAS
jgi:hypothetical protein